VGWGWQTVALWVGLFVFLSFQISRELSAECFLGLHTTAGGMASKGLRVISYQVT